MARMIRCPKCKTEQPLQPTCSSCGFDIRSYALKKKGASPRRIKCPKCSTVQPLQPICSSCGFDIKAHALRARQPRSAATSAGTEATVQMSSPLAGMSAVGAKAAGGTPGGIRPIGDLFSASLAMYKKRALPVLLVWILGAVLTLAAIALFPAIGAGVSMALPDMGGIIMPAASVLAVILGIVAYAVALGALVFSVSDEGAGVKAAFAGGWRRKRSFIWLGIVFSFLLLGGFLFFVLPALIMSFLFVFGIFILAVEDVRGMDALLRSREYIRGRTGAVFIRLLVIWMISAAVGGVPIAGPLLSLAFMPFMLFYVFLLYRDLRESAPLSEGPRAKGKAVYVATALAGFIITPLIAFYAADTYMKSHYGTGAADMLGMAGSIMGSMSQMDQHGGTYQPGAEPGMEYSGEAETVIDGRKERLVFNAEFGSDTQMAGNPARAIVEFKVPTKEEWENRGKVILILDSTRKGEHIAEGGYTQENWMGSQYKDVGEDMGQGRRAAMYYIAYGGQVFFPETSCVIKVGSPYKGTKRSRFSGKIRDCALGSAGITHTIGSMDFEVKGIVPR